MKQGERFLRDEPAKYLAIKEGWLLRGIKLTNNEGQWTMMVAMDDAKGFHKVSFIGGSTPSDCWSYLYLHLTTTSAPVRWMTDKYYKR